MQNINLIEAAKEGNLSRVKDAIKNGADIECREDELNKTPLEYAAENGHLKIVKYLVENNANVDVGGPLPSMTPLCAAALKNHLDVVKYLIENKANIEATEASEGNEDHFGRRPLHFAASGCHLEVVKYLVKNGACVNARDTFDENSPLHHVAYHDDAPTSKFCWLSKCICNHKCHVTMEIKSFMIRNKSAVQSLLI